MSLKNNAVLDCSGRPLPVFCTALVDFCRQENGAKPAGSVYRIRLTASNGIHPTKVNAGQFFLLRSVPSGVLLGRAISVYYATSFMNESVSSASIALEFLVLKKGEGTRELCSMHSGDKIQLIGPLGNCFPNPSADGINLEDIDESNIEKPQVCIIGGGVGVAPVAGFASTLPAQSYDFYASFKSGSYGLDRIDPVNLVVTTDDGSVGIKGMFSAALDADKIKSKGYKVVYACGPTPMLSYVKAICKEAGVKCYISMESRMACGMGACLGCTIKTSEGNKRCCKDGPVFDASILDFTALSPLPRRTALEENADLSVNIAGIKFSNPVIAASGTFGYGSEYASVFDVNKLGGICSKGLTLEARSGNDGIRLVETASGLINSIGLENPGVKHFIANELPAMQKLSPVTIANLSGSTIESYVEAAKLLDSSSVPMIELNISCPNVKSGGMAWGMDCTAASQVVKAVRQATKKPLMVKLSPNAPDLIAVAMACKNAGADALSLINTIQAVAIDIDKGEPVFNNIRAGYCGPAVKPIALRMVYDLVQAMNKLPKEERIPVVGIGGISSWRDAVEFIMAGASAIEVGTATFANPYAMVEIIDGLAMFMKRRGYKTIDDMRGIAQR
ncbi:MAG: dihydroorotate dehydrogenase [Treponema sp.]|nr:dihydroorotate dehydrogenase [Treponema sp.]